MTRTPGEELHGNKLPVKRAQCVTASNVASLDITCKK